MGLRVPVIGGLDPGPECVGVCRWAWVCRRLAVNEDRKYKEIKMIRQNGRVKLKIGEERLVNASLLFFFLNLAFQLSITMLRYTGGLSCPPEDQYMDSSNLFNCSAR